MTRKLCIAALVMTAAVGGTGVADELSIAPTTTGESGLFTLFSGDTLEQGRWSTSLWLSNVDRQFDIDGLRDDLAGFDQSTVRVSVAYGITDALEAAVSLPYEDINLDSRVGDDASGLGNLRAGVKFRVLGERDSPTTMAINVFAEPETGDEDVVGRDSDTGFGAGLNWRFNKWVANLGYHDPGNDSESLLAGIGYVGTVSDRLDWITELSALFFDNAVLEDSYDLTTGGRIWLGADQTMAFNFGLRTDLNQLSSIDDHCPVGGLLGLAFVPGGRATRLRSETTVAPERPALGPPTTATPAPGVAPGTSPGTAPGTAPGARPAPGSPAPIPPAVAPPGTAPAPSGTPPTPGAPPATTTPPSGASPVGSTPPAMAPLAPAPSPATVETIDFPPGAARMSNIAKAKLDDVALQLKQDPRLRAYIVGHADRSGSEDANLRLSRERAEFARQYLVSRHGIDASRIVTEGRGSSEATGDASADRHITVTVRLP